MHLTKFMHMVKLNYEVKKVQPVEMFAMGAHVETVVLMSRVDR